MCGIAGMVGSPSPDEGLLRRMARQMVHRGPDSEGTWHDQIAGFAFRRLAIIDLDDRSNQPLHFGEWHLVFNGEIYNYRELRDELQRLGYVFQTEGDGEVLLYAWAEWEEEALARLNGMFAFAIWNDERRELVCARDPFGEKPLYWATASAGIVFASDVRALLEARPDLGAPDPGAVNAYLNLGLMPPPNESYFVGIKRLPGAHLLRFSGGHVSIEQYWSPRQVEVPREFADAAAELRRLLTDSIRLRLRSDVPIGTSLSGGLDSSAIVCLASEIAGDHRRHAFTARFPGFERDEWQYAALVAASAGVVQHHSIVPTAAELIADLPTLIQDQEEPFGSTSIYAQWRVMKAAHDEGVTVLLDGQGADELLGGYQGAAGWALRSQGVIAVLRGLLSTGERAEVVLALGSEWTPSRVGHWLGRRQSTPYAAKRLRDLHFRTRRRRVASGGLRSPLAVELLRQALSVSLPDLLRYADKNSMAHSREVRLPFLDRRVAEFCLSLPADFVYRRQLRKAILREAVRDVVPNEVLARRDKIGYEPPQRQWLSEAAFVALTADVLLDKQARERGLYNSRIIEEDATAQRWRDTNGVWRALNLELWLRSSSR